MVRRLFVSLTFAAVALHAGLAFAQGVFPTNGAAPVAGLTEDCSKELMLLREEAETRGRLIKAASASHAPADEACKLIVNFGMAEVKLLKYAETHGAQCGIPQQMLDQLKTGHRTTETMQQKVCAAAQQVLRKVPAGPVGDFDVVR